jgi:basic amino acid/polyamine antiporter, APA family
MQEEKKLRKEISFLGLIAMSVGGNIGGALFSLTNIAGNLAGPALPLAMLISALPVLLALIPLSVLTSSWATTSGTYRYAQLLNPRFAFVIMLSLAVCAAIGGQPLFALTFGLFLEELVPIQPILSGALLLIFFFLINLLGIKLTARIQAALFLILVAALLMYVAIGAPQVSLDNFAGFFATGAGGLLAAAGILFTFCAGGLLIIDVGSEVISGESTYPRALFVGILIALAIYIAIHFVTIGVFNWQALADTTLLEVAAVFMSRGALTVFIIGGALVACATTVNILFTYIPRGLMVVSGEGLLPPFLGRVNRRFGTPHWALAVTCLLAVVAIIVIPSLFFFGAMLNFGLILAITAICLAGGVLPKKYPLLYERARIKFTPRSVKAVSYLIAAINGLIFIFLALAMTQSALIYAGIVVVFYLYSLTRNDIFKGIVRMQKEQKLPDEQEAG